MLKSFLNMENINGSFDPFQRYKMPKLEIRIQSNKTVFLNLDKVSKALDRPAPELLKMFSLRRQTGSNVKDLSLSGNHQLSDLKEDLKWYIETYIRCRTCDNPETDYVLTTRVKLCCKACGAVSVISGLSEASEKLNKYLIN